MKINADFNKRVVVHSGQSEWIESPMKGVFRRPLDRVGSEIARATTVVKYAPNSKFSPHIHTGGEEFLVLEGLFQDEHGDYPVGSYLRNPPESRHTPSSKSGCVMLVKLWQFSPQDRNHVQINANFMQSVPHRAIDNVSLIPLYCDEYEEVSIQHWQPDSTIQIEAQLGLEVFVIEGTFTEGVDELVSHSWLRIPSGTSLNVTTGSCGAKVWVKRNHLKNVDKQIQRVTRIR
jgi:hypothetical protein